MIIFLFIQNFTLSNVFGNETENDITITNINKTPPYYMYLLALDRINRERNTAKPKTATKRKIKSIKCNNIVNEIKYENNEEKYNIIQRRFTM